MHITRRNLLIAASGGVLGSFAVAGCGRSTASPSATASAGAAIDDSPATGTVEVWAMGTEGEKLSDLVAGFQKVNPKATVKVTPVPWADYSKKIETAVASGSTPDATMIGSSDLAAFVAGGGLEPVPKGLVDASSFFPGAQSGTVIDGVSWAVPWYVETRVLFYRKDLADAAGVTAPTTWEEFATFCKGLQGNGATWGFSIPTGTAATWQSVLPSLWQAGAELTDKDLNAFTFDTPEAVKGLTHYQSLFTEGLASRNGPVNLGEVEPKFVSGEVASFLSGPWEMGLLTQAGGADFLSKVGLTAIPAGPATNTSYIGGSHFSVFKDAGNREAAWKLIRWFSQPDTQADFFTLAGDLPAVQSAWKSATLTTDPHLSVFGDQLEHAQNAPAVTTWPQVSALVDSGAEKVAKGVSNPADALKEIQAGAKKIGTGK